MDWLEQNKVLVNAELGTLHWSDDESDIYYDVVEGPIELDDEKITKFSLGEEYVGSVLMHRTIEKFKKFFTTELKDLSGAQLPPVSIGKVEKKVPVSQK